MNGNGQIAEDMIELAWPQSDGVHFADEPLLGKGSEQYSSIRCAIQEGFDIADGHLVGCARQTGAFNRGRRPVEFENCGGMS